MEVPRTYISYTDLRSGSNNLDYLKQTGSKHVVYRHVIRLNMQV